LKAGKYFWWISYETYCLKVSLSKKLILSQFSQKKITNFFYENKKKLKNTKKKNPTYNLSPPHLFQKNVFDGLILGRKRKIWDYWLNLAICQNLFSLIL